MDINGTKNYWRLENQDRTEIIDIGARRTAHFQILQCTEKSVTIIIFKHGPRAQTQGGGTGYRVGAVQGAGIVFRAIDAIGIAGYRMDIRMSVQRYRQAQQEFRITSATAFAAHRYRGFAAGNQHA